MEKWREVYQFQKGGSRMVSQKDKYAWGKFVHIVDPKNGYLIKECIDAREKRVLEFLVPIFYLEKPTRVIVMIRNTIFGSLSRDRRVDWARMTQDLVSKLVGEVRKQKGTPISPFFYHLYKHEGLLKLEEEMNWNIQKALLKYGEETEMDLDEHFESNI